MEDMDALDCFNSQLVSLYNIRPPIPEEKITLISQAALIAMKHYKDVVKSIEKFIRECKPEYKTAGLFVIDSIICQSLTIICDSEKYTFASFFVRDFQTTFAHLYCCPDKDKIKIVEVLFSWDLKKVFSPQIIHPLIYLTATSNKFWQQFKKNSEAWSNRNGLNSSTCDGNEATEELPANFSGVSLSHSKRSDNAELGTSKKLFNSSNNPNRNSNGENNDFDELDPCSITFLKEILRQIYVLTTAAKVEPDTTRTPVNKKIVKVKVKAFDDHTLIVNLCLDKDKYFEFFKKTPLLSAGTKSSGLRSAVRALRQIDEQKNCDGNQISMEDFEKLVELSCKDSNRNFIEFEKSVEPSGMDEGAYSTFLQGVYEKKAENGYQLNEIDTYDTVLQSQMAAAGAIGIERNINFKRIIKPGRSDDTSSPTGDDIADKEKMSTSKNIANEVGKDKIQICKRLNKKQGDTDMFSETFIFFSAFCWESEKISRFFKAAHNSVKEKTDYDTKRFKQSVDAEAITERLWYPKDNWRHLIGEDHWWILTSYERSGKGYYPDTKSVINLLRFIRNKLEHSSNFGYKEKESLGWFQWVDGRWELSQHQFVTYWIERFPKLINFIWRMFMPVRNLPTLDEFYPPHLSINRDFTRLGFYEFENRLLKFGQDQILKGELKARCSITMGTTKATIELQNFSQIIIKSLLSEKLEAVEIQVLPDHLTFMWYDSQYNLSSLKYKSCLKLHEKFREKNNSATFIVTNNVLNLFKNLMENKVKRCSKSAKFTVLSYIDDKLGESQAVNFEESVQKLACQTNGSFKSTPLQWNELRELSLPFSKHVENTNLESFWNKKSSLSLVDILPMAKPTHTNLLSNLSGNLLSNMLRQKSLSLFSKHKRAPLWDIYMNRRISKLNEVGSQIFKQISGDNVFIVTNIDEKTFQKIVQTDKEIIDICELIREIEYLVKRLNSYNDLEDDVYGLSVLSATKKQANKSFLYFASDGLPDYDHVITTLKEMDEVHRNYHIMRYNGHQTFHWLKTVGSHMIFNDFCTEFVYQSRNENEFLSYINSAPKNERVIILANKAGMGKTQLLLKLADKLEQTDLRTVVLFVSMKDFANSLEKTEVSLNSIVLFFCKVYCANSFEMDLLQYWLTAKKHTQVKIEIMLDGFDEVYYEFQARAFKIVELIKENFPLVRVWVSVRDHMANELKTKVRGFAYYLEPFNEKEQIEFLVRYWSDCLTSSRIPHSVIDKESLQTFASNVIDGFTFQDSTIVAGIPLQCRLIGEYHKSSLLLGNLEVERSSKTLIIDMYEKIIDKNFEVYLTEKNNLPRMLDSSILSTLQRNMESSHTYFAIKLILSDATARKFENWFLSATCNDNVADLVKPGIIQDTNPISFVHRTFAEYLIARFVFRVLTCRYDRITAEDETFQDFLWNEVCKPTREIEFRHPILCNFLNTLLQSQFSSLSVFMTKLQQVLKEFPTNTLVYERTIVECVMVASCKAKTENITMCLLSFKKYFLNLIKNCVGSRKDFLFGKFLLENQSYIFNEAFSSQDTHQIINEAVDAIARDDWWKVSVLRPHRGKIEDFLNFMIEKDRFLIESKDTNGRTPILKLLSVCWKNMRSPQIRSSDAAQILKLFEELNENFHDLSTSDKKRLNDWWYINFDSIVDLVKYFVTDLKADICAVDDFGNTVLHIPDVFDSKFEMIKEIDLGPCPPFFTFGPEEHLTLLYFFMENGCNQSTINSVNKMGHTPFMTAIWHLQKYFQYPIYVWTYKKFGADFYIVDRAGNSALHLAIEAKFPLCFINELIDCGADILLANKEGQNALHRAATVGELDVVKTLIERHKANILERDVNGKTVLEYQCNENVTEYLKTLVTKRKDN